MTAAAQTTSKGSCGIFPPDRPDKGDKASMMPSSLQGRRVHGGGCEDALLNPGWPPPVDGCPMVLLVKASVHPGGRAGWC